MKDNRLEWEDDICPICGLGANKHKFNDECLQIAMMKVKGPFLEIEENRNKWYHVKVTVVMKYLEKRWIESGCQGDKFESRFIPSVLEFYKDKGFISRKQLTTVENVLSGSSYEEDCYKEINELHGDMLADYARGRVFYDYMEWKTLKPKVRRYYKEGWLY